MSKYRVIRGSNRLYSVFDDNSPICRMIADEMEANGLLAELENRDENAATQLAANDVLLKGYARQSAEKDETIATQALALEAQSERIKALEKFIRDIADSAMPEKESNQALLFRATVRDAKTFMQDKAVKPDAPVSAPKFRYNVGDKVRIIGLDEYPQGAFDTITKRELHWEQINYGLKFWDWRPTDFDNAVWKDNELIPYIEESESDKQAE